MGGLMGWRWKNLCRWIMLNAVDRRTRLVGSKELADALALCGIGGYENLLVLPTGYGDEYNTVAEWCAVNLSDDAAFDAFRERVRQHAYFKNQQNYGNNTGPA